MRAPGEPGRPGVRSQLLLEPQPGRQPVRQGMIKLQGNAELRKQTRDEVAPADVGQLVSEYGPPLLVVPGLPVLRKQNERSIPADRGGSRQLGRAAQFHGMKAAHLGTEESDGVDQGRIGEGFAARPQLADRPEA